ncbi:MAG: hypothetical protein E7012_01170 [Alphaproteobacteria bacterium]|nr:hypothetical protein [Alphaproteobacteria bacterium]
MSKTKVYFGILIAVISVIAVGFIMNIDIITSFTHKCLNYAGQNILSVSAAICAFLFLGNKNYWLIILACAAITALIIQSVIIAGSLNVINLSAMILTFMAIVFLMNFAKLLINK